MGKLMCAHYYKMYKGPRVWILNAFLFETRTPICERNEASTAGVKPIKNCQRLFNTHASISSGES